MPWTETNVMDQRIEFIKTYIAGGESKSEICRRFGISRPTGSKWLARHAEAGVGALMDRSRAPKRHPNQVGEELEEMILALRRRYCHWGPRKLRVLLLERYPQFPWPACSTIGEILRRHGLTVRRKRRRRTPPYTQPFSACTHANAVWCTDFKGWFRTGEGRRCDPLTISDGCTRYLLRVQALTEMRLEVVRPIFEACFREYGLPQAIRSDNGSPFASRGIGGLSRLSVWWLKLGIEPERIAPGKPQQNGRHERMHLTLKRETASPPASTIRRQQAVFDRFVEEFNAVRPHEALGQRCPGSLYSSSPRAYRESVQPVEYPGSMEVRSVKSNGVIHWRGRTLFLGEALGGERVGLCEVADGRWAVYYCQTALGIVSERHRRVVGVAAAVEKGLVSKTALQSPFRCASGPLQGQA